MLQRSRILAVTTLGVVLSLLLVLEGRLFLLQVVQRSQHAEKIRNYQFKQVQVPVPRGEICDCNGVVLATSIPALEVWAFTRDVENTRTKKSESVETAHLLGPLLDMEPQRILEILNQPGYRPVRRDVTDPGVKLELHRLKRERYLRGIDLIKKYSRRYPHGDLLGHILGFVDHAGKGVCGVEHLQDGFLGGREGARVFRKDGVQNEIYSAEEWQKQGIPGGSVTLTVDSAIQLFAEVELAKIEQRFRPNWSAAVVMEPDTGKILAAASLPGLIPAAPADGRPDHWMNRAFSATYTPGSTFKPLMMAMALDRGVVRPQETIDCEGGVWYAGRRRITDVHVNYRILDPAGILIKSSNIGMSKIALRMVPENAPRGAAEFKSLRDTLGLLGFGSRLKVLSPQEEAPGTVTALKDWSRIYTLVSVAFGNEIAVTPVQMAAAYCALVNGGRYVPPRLIERMTTCDGQVITPPRSPTRRTFSEATSALVKEMLARVVEEGSGRGTRIPGVRVGGKTGTAEKLPERKEVTASFAGFAPAEKPALVVLVVVDEPQGKHYASEVAAPHVKAILERALSHLGIRVVYAAGKPR